MVLCSCVKAHGQWFRAGCRAHSGPAGTPVEAADEPPPGSNPIVWRGGNVQCLQCAAPQTPELIADEGGTRWIVPDHRAGRAKHCLGGGVVLLAVSR